MAKIEMTFRDSKVTAEAIYKYMREGNDPEPDASYYMDKKPLIDNLRKLVTEDDIDWILELSKCRSDITAGFAISLLRHQVTQRRVEAYLKNRWDSASTYLKNRIMWRLLDVPGLTETWHHIFIEFIFKHWDTFNEFNKNYFGQFPVSLLNLLSRLGDPSFPTTKKWIYFCCIPGLVSDKYAVTALMDTAAANNDALTKKARDAIMERFFKSNNGKPGIFLSHRQSLTGTVNEKMFLDFVAEAIIRHLKEGNWQTHILSDTDGDLLNRLPLIDILRSKVDENDVSSILRILESQEGEAAGLYLSLLKRFTKTNNEVKSWLKTHWAQSSPFLKAHLMWRILDDPGLTDKWHRNIFTFVLSEWEVFNHVSLKFLGTPQTVILQVLKRIGDPDYPSSKRWSYLCRFPDAAEDREAARSLLWVARNMKDNTPFTQEVADTLWEKFFSK
jgi:hypothetical protein